MSNVAIVGAGINSNIEAQVDPSMQALRASMRPLEWTGTGKVLGHYRLVAVSGTIAASLGGASELFGARWGDTSNFVVITKLSAGLGVYTAAQTVANPLELDCIFTRGWTVNYTTNATAVVPGAGMNKMRSSNMGTSKWNSLGNISICTTTGMTGGTKTNDSAAFGAAVYPGNALGVADTKDLYLVQGSGIHHPAVLESNEGVIIRNIGAFGAAATYKLVVIMEWAEVPAF